MEGSDANDNLFTGTVCFMVTSLKSNVLSRNKVRPFNFNNFLKVRITITLELFGSQEGVLRF